VNTFGNIVYQALKEDVEKMWKVKAIAVPVVIGAPPKWDSGFKVEPYAYVVYIVIQFAYKSNRSMDNVINRFSQFSYIWIITNV